MESLEERARGLLKKACEWVTEDGGLDLMVLGLREAQGEGDEGESFLVQAGEAAVSDTAKEFLCRGLRQMFEEKKCDSCYVIMEAWALKTQKALDREDLPACLGDDPRSTEVVLVAAHNTLGEKFAINREINRDAEGKISGFGEEQVCEDFSGRFVEILKPSFSYQPGSRAAN